MTKDEQWLLKEKYQGEKSEGFFADCKRLQAGEPLAFIIGSIPFLNTTIYLDSHPLIPRSETEFWTEKALKAINARPEAHVLDLCAGSGAIGVAVASASPTSIVHFAELNEDHLATIAKNIIKNDIPTEHCEVVGSDLFEKITDTFDFILTNPPYIDPALDRTETSVKQFEPDEALYGGKHGLELITSIIADAPEFLNPSGELWIEHEPEQAAAIQVLGARAGFLPTTHIDQYGIARYSVLMLK